MGVYGNEFRQKRSSAVERWRDGDLVDAAAGRSRSGRHSVIESGPRLWIRSGALLPSSVLELHQASFARPSWCKSP